MFVNSLLALSFTVELLRRSRSHRCLFYQSYFEMEDMLEGMHERFEVKLAQSSMWNSVNFQIVQHKPQQGIRQREYCFKWQYMTFHYEYMGVLYIPNPVVTWGLNAKNLVVQNAGFIQFQFYFVDIKKRKYCRISIRYADRMIAPWMHRRCV